MKTKMKIFNVIFALTMLVVPAHVRADDLSACDGYEYFSPAFALCTVHAYNIGDRTNPTSDARTAEMNDVIALKSTVIAQQLKEQYDILNTMIKRFKTQLEKAVLTSKIEVLTGNSSTSNSSSGSDSVSNGISIAGASDCQTYSGSANIGQCLMTNSAITINAANNDTGSAKKQLANDLYTADMYSLCSLEKGANNSCCSRVQLDSSKKTPRNISDMVNALDKNSVVQCAQSMRAKISTKLEDLQRQNNRNPWGP